MTNLSRTETVSRTEAARDQPVEGSPSHTPAGDDVFTRFVRALADESEELNELVGVMMEKLRQTLRREMRIRSLWSSPPAFVGIYGHGSWTSYDRRTLGPLEDFLHECYTYLFVDQVARFKAHLKDPRGIDGLVVRYLQIFLGRRQKDHDPLGYHLFEVVQQAVRDAVRDGSLHVLEGPERIANATLLGMDPSIEEGGVVEDGAMLSIVADWNHALMPGLVTAKGKELRGVTADLRARLAKLDAQGVEKFYFKTLIDAVKRDVRHRMMDAFKRSEGDTLERRLGDGAKEIIRVFRPETRTEDVDSFRKLVHCVTDRIPGLNRQSRTLKNLDKLWTYLCRLVGFGDADGLPSFRHLEKELEVSRDQLPGLIQALGGLIRQCQDRLSGGVVDLEERRAGGHDD